MNFSTISLKVISNNVLIWSNSVFLHAIKFCWYSRPRWTADFIVVDMNSLQISTLVFRSNVSSFSERLNLWRRFLKRTHLWLVDHCSPTRSFRLDFICLLQFPAIPLRRSWIQLRIPRDVRSIRTKGRGLLSVRVSWNQTNWPRLG